MSDEERIRNFDWRDYVQLDEDIEEVKKEDIEKTLDLIFIDRDGDGRIDNKYAEKLARDLKRNLTDRKGNIDKVNIIQDDLEYTTYSPYTKTLNISYNEAGFFANEETGKVIPTTLNRSLFNGLAILSDSRLHKKSLYKEEKDAMKITNDYMELEFEEPRKEIYLASYFDFTNKDIHIYQDGMKFKDIEKHTLPLTPEIIKNNMQDPIDFNQDRLVDKAVKAMWKDLNQGIKELKSLTKKDQKEIADFLKEEVSPEKLEENLDEILDVYKLLKCASKSESNNKYEESSIKWAKEVEELLERVIEKHKGKEDKSSIDLEGMNLKSLKDIMHQESSVAEVINSKAKFTPAEENHQAKKLAETELV